MDPDPEPNTYGSIFVLNKSAFSAGAAIRATFRDK